MTNNFPLDTLITKKNYELIECMLKNGFDGNIVGKMNKTYLQVAVSNKDLKLATILVDNGAEVEKSTQHFTSPLNMAIDQKNVEMAKFLMDHVKDISIADSKGYTALNAIEKSKNQELIKYYEEKFGQINSQKPTPSQQKVTQPTASSRVELPKSQQKAPVANAKIQEDNVDNSIDEILGKLPENMKKATITNESI
ncbi:hypothetical protein TVAG_168790 [Trichomonas vaginalis G3]|uniref:Uncharacterized protein n=1 Tax=Trichomonas vaginalis (strain ATCC PRA-98 / G3) TaxID=412133 RepID=A2FHF3_TRIV3|nr:hypothetical protein TVAGG3_0451260 [Trichomonas vaginalis G3]EAX95670.1 hypothetical protein TVAG_168790 [Trichomonas vaginalis G3]KAI5538172.1 hypothetical protein TVAGG3_0451260 [Trichomonas vaginalis G3]|eukprot:XP_001308600.1 hypothetical protein [Trichomonas vaginalis G3]